MATLPTSPGFSSMRAIRRSSSVMAMSPRNFTQQVYSWGGRLRVVEFTLPPMTAAQADDWTKFFDDCDGYAHTFTANISAAFPHDPSATAVVMRLATPEIEYDVNTLAHYGITFTAMEAL